MTENPRGGTHSPPGRPPSSVSACHARRLPGTHAILGPPVLPPRPSLQRHLEPTPPPRRTHRSRPPPRCDRRPRRGRVTTSVPSLPPSSSKDIAANNLRRLPSPPSRSRDHDHDAPEGQGGSLPTLDPGLAATPSTPSSAATTEHGPIHTKVLAACLSRACPSALLRS